MPSLSFVVQKYLLLDGCSVASGRLVSSLNDVSNERSRLMDQQIIERVFMNRLDDKYYPWMKFRMFCISFDFVYEIVFLVISHVKIY